MTKRKLPSSARGIALAREVASGNVIRALEAHHLPPKGTYRCLDPLCQGDLNVCERPKGSGRFYFRHRACEIGTRCGFHSTNARTQRRHDAAQHLLSVILNEALNKRLPMPILAFPTPGGVRHVVPFIVADSVRTEWVCRNTGRRADIALLDKHQQPVLLIEVFHTHAVDRNKREDFSRHWWIEIEANEIIANQEILPVCHAGNLPFVLDPHTQQRWLPGMRPPQW